MWDGGGKGGKDCLPAQPCVRCKAAKQQSQTKMLFSDVALDAFRCDSRCTQRLLNRGLDQGSAQKLTCTMSDTSAKQFTFHLPPVGGGGDFPSIGGGAEEMAGQALVQGNTYGMRPETRGEMLRRCVVGTRALLDNPAAHFFFPRQRAS